MQPVETTIIIIAALIGFGVFYNQIVAWLEAQGRTVGYVAFLVVVGNLAIIIALDIAFGHQVAGGAFLFNVAAGAPMIIGSWWRHTTQRRRELARAAEIARRNLQGEE